MTTNDMHHTHGIYLDVEMTCWDSPPPLGMKQQIIEIGIVSMDLISLDIILEASYFVRPRQWDISPKCTALTGITKEDIQSARSFPEVIADLTEAFEPKTKLCGTWRDDASVIASTCRMQGLRSPLRYLLDVEHLFQGAFLLKQQVSLQGAVKLLGLEFDGVPHGALADARNTALVHAAIIRRMRREPDPLSVPISEPLEATMSLFAEKLSYSLRNLQKK
jgi:inhibitor of KinA sporulation pathway (predicted exonuclease)